MIILTGNGSAATTFFSGPHGYKRITGTGFDITASSPKIAARSRYFALLRPGQEELGVPPNNMRYGAWSLHLTSQLSAHSPAFVGICDKVRTNIAVRCASKLPMPLWLFVTNCHCYYLRACAPT